MIDFKTPQAVMEKIEPEKRLLIASFRLAVYDYQHPEEDVRSALSAGLYLIMGQQLAFLCGWFPDELQWERLIGSL